MALVFWAARKDRMVYGTGQTASCDAGKVDLQYIWLTPLLVQYDKGWELRLP